ncbi:MAG TPA: hypothetical protein PK668_25630 [Myxococcota bacterium]|nr:hypothetical protein [Myxococcota bacterium]HRY96909.1 hypothetical protein [Myxococcota bacterium]HSA22713.1 hypothetical protein [Myxococcota bacterium]
MHRFLEILLVVLVSLGLAGLAPAADKAKPKARPKPAAKAPKTLCKPDEWVVFGCQMLEGGKLLSVCASKDLGLKDGEVTGTIEYRFGRPGKVELTFPEGGLIVEGAFNFTRYTRPQDTMLALTFVNKGAKYEVYADYVGNDQAAGVRVTPVGKTEPIPLECREPWVDEMMKLEDKGFAPPSDGE